MVYTYKLKYITQVILNKIISVKKNNGILENNTG